MEIKPRPITQDRPFPARDLVIAMHREAAVRHLQDVAQLAVASEAALTAGNMAALAALSEGLAESHQAFRVAAISMAHARSAEGIA